MIDPRHDAVLILETDGRIVDRTCDVLSVSAVAHGRRAVQFTSSDKEYRFGPGRVLHLRHPRRIVVDAQRRVQVDGSVWTGATEVCVFSGSWGEWCHVFYRVAGNAERWITRPSAAVTVLASVVGESSPNAAVLDYFRALTAQLPDDDALRRVYESLTFVHPHSALARYLGVTGWSVNQWPAPLIFPFRRNLSQWQAVSQALTHPISVIKGPPGTGKTETILNLVCNVVASGPGTVAVVSFNNAAVDNVHEKLVEAGLGDMVALLGKTEKRQAFFAGQAPVRHEPATDSEVSEAFPDPERLTALDGRIRALYEAERRRAEARTLLAAFRLEHEHFAQFQRRFAAGEAPDLSGLRGSSERILRFLADDALDAEYPPALVRRLRNFFRYWSLRGLDTTDVQAVLRLQGEFYRRRTAELQSDVDRLDRKLAVAEFDRLVDEHRALSIAVIREELRQRAAERSRLPYSEDSYRQGKIWRSFSHDYPVILSTCHSLRRSLPDGALLDYLIVDEASQVDLLAAVPALSCARNVVIVGDEHQLPHIASKIGEDVKPPDPSYDYVRHSILTSVQERFAEQVPTTLLREHYRCDPAIIGFCNRAFYADELLTFTEPRTDLPMDVRATAPGNHHRRHRTNGHSNQRELDVILQEVVPDLVRSMAPEDIGVTTPFRVQADKGQDLLDRQDVDTVHRFQGRQKRAVVLSTVIDETADGKKALRFVDDPRLINVAVSRAVERFVLVTDHRLLPRSRYIRDLIDYIRYQRPTRPLVSSRVVSVFDLLYREYSEVLRPLAARVNGGSAFRSENIIETVLGDILTAPAYAHLTSCRQVRLLNLLPGTDHLTPEEQRFTRHPRTSLDFVVYNRVSNVPVIAIEVDGFAYHEDDPKQLARDRLKDGILERHGLPVLRLATTGSDEERRIKEALDAAERRLASAVIDLTEKVEVRPVGRANDELL